MVVLRNVAPSDTLIEKTSLSQFFAPKFRRAEPVGCSRPAAADQSTGGLDRRSTPSPWREQNGCEKEEGCEEGRRQEEEVGNRSLLVTRKPALTRRLSCVQDLLFIHPPGPLTTIRRRDSDPIAPKGNPILSASKALHWSRLLLNRRMRSTAESALRGLRRKSRFRLVPVVPLADDAWAWHCSLLKDAAYPLIAASRRNATTMPRSQKTQPVAPQRNSIRWGVTRRPSRRTLTRRNGDIRRELKRVFWVAIEGQSFGGRSRPDALHPGLRYALSRHECPVFAAIPYH